MSIIIMVGIGGEKGSFDNPNGESAPTVNCPGKRRLRKVDWSPLPGGCDFFYQNKDTTDLAIW